MELSEAGFAESLTGGVVGTAFDRALKQEDVGTAIGGGGADGATGGGGGSGAGGGAVSGGERYNEKTDTFSLGITVFKVR